MEIKKGARIVVTLGPHQGKKGVVTRHERSSVWMRVTSALHFHQEGRTIIVFTDQIRLDNGSKPS